MYNSLPGILILISTHPNMQAILLLLDLFFFWSSGIRTKRLCCSELTKNLRNNFSFGFSSPKMIRLQNNVGNYTQVILLLSDLYSVQSRGIWSKIVRTKVSFGHILYSEHFCSEIRAFGDRVFGDRTFREPSAGLPNPVRLSL
jgi:hypothetical protein